MHKQLILLGIFLVTLLSGNILRAQQEAQYTQYMYNTLSINPAYAGSRDVLSALLLHRSQWVGIDGAPTTQILSVHTPVGGEKVGVGVNIINDNIGPARETTFDANFSYTIQNNNDANFSFGLKAGAHMLDVDYSKLNIYDPTDPNYQQNNIDNKISPQLGVGFMYYTEKFYAGISAPNVLQTKHFETSNNSNTIAKERINYYLIAGYVFDISNQVKFKPTILTKTVAGAPLQVDASINFLMYDHLTLGAAYRWDAAFSGLAGFQFSDSIMVGFAYDTDTTDFGEYNDGSFEVFLRYELFKKYKKMVTPRFF